MKTVAIAAAVLTALVTQSAALPYDSVTAGLADVEDALGKNCGYAGNRILDVSDAIDALSDKINLGFLPVAKASPDKAGTHEISTDIDAAEAVVTSLQARRDAALVAIGECLLVEKRPDMAEKVLSKALKVIKPTDGDLWKRARRGLWTALGVPEVPSD